MSLKRKVAIKQSVNEAKPASRFFRRFDWRLQASLVLLVLIGIMAWDPLNNALNRVFQPKTDPAPNPASWTAGSEHTVVVTLITADRDTLSCGDDRRFEDYHCEYNAAKSRVPPESGSPQDDNRAHIIQPYRTAVGNHLVFIAGLWNTPEVALRHHQEPPAGKKSNELKRFAASCKLRFLGSMENVWVRWGTTSNWYTEKSAPVAVAESCEIPKPEAP